MDDDVAPYTFEALQGVAVVVRANGFSYRGVLVGADESELYLRGEMRWIVLPLAGVTSVVPAAQEGPLGLPDDVAALDPDVCDGDDEDDEP